jgi:hypothetical protein
MQVMKSRPTLFKQEERPTCWAAALASWLSIKSSRTSHDPEFLLEYFKGLSVADSGEALIYDISKVK